MNDMANMPSANALKNKDRNYSPIIR